MSKLGDVLSKPVQLNRLKEEGLGAELQFPEAMEVWRRRPQPLGNFEKKLF